MQFFSNDLGISLGTSNIMIYVDGKGIMVREPSVVALDRNSGKVLQVGAAAYNMLGRTPGNVVAMHPIKGGVVADHGTTVKLLQILFAKLSPRSFLSPKPRVIISVPSGITEVEERTIINAAIEAGARRVYLMEAPLAAALGAGLDIKGPNGHMLVDIGAGTTDIAVLTMSGVANASSLKTAGNQMDEAIISYVRRNYNMVIGPTVAEEVKMQIGSVYPRHDDVSYTVAAARVITVCHIKSSAAETHETYDDIVSVDSHRLACHDDTVAGSRLACDGDIWSDNVYRALQLYLAGDIEHHYTWAASLASLAQCADAGVCK